MFTLPIRAPWALARHLDSGSQLNQSPYFGTSSCPCLMLACFWDVISVRGDVENKSEAIHP